MKARLSRFIQKLKYTSKGINNVLTLNQGTSKVPVLFWGVKLGKLMCIQQFLMLLKQKGRS